MRVLGLSTGEHRTNKGLNRRRGPLFEIAKSDWRLIDAQDEFPKQGQIFWPQAREAQDRALVFVNPKENPGGVKDNYRVEGFEFPSEVLDLRAYGDPKSVGSAIVHGLRRVDVAARTVLLWCAPSVLVGPVKLSLTPKGLLTLDSSPRTRIATFQISADAVRSVNDGRNERYLLSAELGAPSGFVDWDDDRVIVRRALTAAVERAKRTGADPGLTKRMIEDAAEAIVGVATGADVQLEKYRLERARALCADTALIASVASELATDLLQHPEIIRSLDVLRSVRKQELEVELRAELGTQLAAVRTELDRVTEAAVKGREEVASAKANVATLQQEFVAAENALEQKVADAEQEVARRLADVVSKPPLFLPGSPILQPFLTRKQIHATARRPHLSGALDGHGQHRRWPIGLRCSAR